MILREYDCLENPVREYSREERRGLLEGLIESWRRRMNGGESR